MSKESKNTPATLKERRGVHEKTTTFLLSYNTALPLPCKAVNAEGEIIGIKDTVLKAVSCLKIPAATTLRAIADSCDLSESQAYRALITLRLDSKLKYVALPGKPSIYIIEQIAEYPANICRFTGGACDVSSCLFLNLCQNGNAKIKEAENA